ncbi:hypothetical protein PoB_003146000 [Plakobranchus ocellatus]|uniref:Uncharacterized protein n=1 Tax=Plakobranchus ocellatus TaxID=259542 RepID=A0AAV4AC78_9GAST|nr:hypothetical protein PoB_003146000 [Plakobranchus ocellatus]
MNMMKHLSFAFPDVLNCELFLHFMRSIRKQSASSLICLPLGPFEAAADWLGRNCKGLAMLPKSLILDWESAGQRLKSFQFLPISRADEEWARPKDGK